MDASHLKQKLNLKSDSSRVWSVLEAYSKVYPVDSIQLISYNDFLQHKLPKMLEANSIFYIYASKEKKVKIAKFQFFNPNYILPYHYEVNGKKHHIFPVEACERGSTYCSDILCSLKVDDLVKGSSKIHNNILIGKVPVMTGSSICNLTNNTQNSKTKMCQMDVNGEFIVNGSKKVVIAQERSNFNKISVFKQNKKKANAPFEIFSVIRSSATSTTHTSISKIGITKDGKVHVQLPYISSTINIVIMFKALGTFKEEEILDFMLLNSDEKFYTLLKRDMLKNFERGFGCKTQEQALCFICNEIKGNTDKKNNLMSYVLSNIPLIELLKNEKTQIENKKEWIEENKDLFENYNNLEEFDESEEFANKVFDVFEIIKTKIEFAKAFLKSDFFPTYKSNYEKKCYMGLAVCRFFEVKYGYALIEDRDLMSKKRVETSGALLSNLFYNGLKKMILDFQKNCDKNYHKGNFNIQNTIQTKFITKMFVNALSTGNWGTKNNNKIGVSQTFDQFNFQMRVINLRKLTAPISVEGKIIDPRRLHGSHYGFICPADSPEGKKVGLNKIFSMTANVTVDNDPSSIIEFIKSLDVHFLKEGIKNKEVKIFINNRWIACSDNEKAIHLFSLLKKMKRSGNIATTTSIVFSPHDELCILTDAGRIYRPVFVVENGKLMFSENNINENKKVGEWSELITSGGVEFIDPDENEAGLLSESLEFFYKLDLEERKKYSYCEIHPATILGAGASTVPRVECNQAPRNSYQCNMCKQAVGIPYLNYRTMLCGSCHILHYGQKPIVSSKMSRLILKYDDMPTGINAIIAICPYKGYNQEDSNVINSASVQRGLFHSSKYIVFEENIMIHKEEEWGVASRDKCERFQGGDPQCLESDFCVGVGMIVKRGDVLIGKIRKIKDCKKKYVDMSLILRDCEVAQIMTVQRGFDNKNYASIKIQIVEIRIPEIGDKFASRIAQKGTLGKMVRQEDLPFSQDIFTSPVPDIILNPLAFPSRMTIGQLIEQSLGKKCCSTNKNASVWKKGKAPDKKTEYDDDFVFGNCTSFEYLNIEEITEVMRECGFNPKGKESMIDGMTGRPITMMIFKSVVYMQRLKHMVRDKMHVRSKGPTQNLNRQPTEGRNKHGGLKLGEMERDCLIANGSTHILKDRLSDCSDSFLFYVCDVCGLIAICNPKLKRYECMVCETNEVSEVKVTYGIKLVIQELLAMNLAIRILVNKEEGTIDLYK